MSIFVVQKLCKAMDAERPAAAGQQEDTTDNVDDEKAIDDVEMAET